MRSLPFTVVISLASAGLILSACATKPVVYGPIGPKMPHGYADRQNPDGGHAITIVMPGSATPAALREFFNRRAGELCPAGVEKTTVFRLDRNDITTSGYVYGGAGLAQRMSVGTVLEGYAYCKPGAPAAAAGPAS